MSSFAESDMMGFSWRERGRAVPDYEIHIKPPYILYGKAGCRELLYAFGGGSVHTTGSSFADSGRAPSYITLLPIVLAFQFGACTSISSIYVIVLLLRAEQNKGFVLSVKNTAFNLFFPFSFFFLFFFFSFFLCLLVF